MPRRVRVQEAQPEHALAVVPARCGRRDLPVWHVPVPLGGWTLAATEAAALAYAAEHAEALEIREPALARAVWVDLVDTCQRPPRPDMPRDLAVTIRRAEILRRINGGPAAPATEEP